MLLRLLRGLTVCLAPAGTRSRVAPVQPEGGSARPKAACRERLQSGGHCSRVPPRKELLNRTPSWVTVKSTAPRGLSCDGSRCVETQGGCCLERAQGRAGQQPRRSTPAGDCISRSPPARSPGDGTARDRAVWTGQGGGGVGCKQPGPPSCRRTLRQSGWNGGAREQPPKWAPGSSS